MLADSYISQDLLALQELEGSFENADDDENLNQITFNQLFGLMLEDAMINLERTETLK